MQRRDQVFAGPVLAEIEVEQHEIRPPAVQVCEQGGKGARFHHLGGDALTTECASQHLGQQPVILDDRNVLHGDQLAIRAAGAAHIAAGSPRTIRVPPCGRPVMRSEPSWAAMAHVEL